MTAVIRAAALLALLVAHASPSLAQAPVTNLHGEACTLYDVGGVAEPGPALTVQARDRAARLSAGATVTARTQGRAATFVVRYTGFTAAAQAAFQSAVDVWADHIESPVEIRIDAQFGPLASNVLGAAGPRITANFGGGQSQTWYPFALADAIVGRDLFPESAGDFSPDIEATFNSAFTDFYFGTDGNPPAGEFDFRSVVLHELGHGLGFVGSGEVDDGVISSDEPDPECDGVSGHGCWGITSGTFFAPVIYDRLVEDASGVAMTNTATYPQNSTALGDLLTSNGLSSDVSTKEVFLDGTSVREAYGGVAPIYAPRPAEPGSSFSHWDESVFRPADGSNALMTPGIARGEAYADPGALTCALFQDLGWTLAPACSALVADPGGPTAAPPTLTSPADGAVDVPVASTTFEYETSVRGSIALEVAEDAAFTTDAGFAVTSLSSSEVDTGSSYRAMYAATGTGLAPGRTYYWRATNTTEAVSSEVRTFETEADLAPTFSTTPETEAADGAPYSYAVAASDPNGLAVTLTAPTLPAWLAFADNGDGTGTLAGTPAQSDVGSHPVTLVADDGTTTTEQAFTVVVADVNNAPVAARDSVGTLEEVAVAVAVLANDTDADGDALSVASVDPPSNGTTTTDGTTVTYTPAVDFVGTDAFTYVVTDGTVGVVGTVVVTVGGRNDAPTAVDDNAETDEDTPVTIAVLDNDSDVDGDADLVVTALSDPENGTVALDQDGAVTYTPAPDFFGEDAFTYTVDDQSGPVGTPTGRRASATATVRVTVRSVNDPPVAPAVTFPADGETYTFVRNGEPQGFGVSWPAGTDPDSPTSKLQYRWEAATTTGFDPIAIEVEPFVGVTSFSGGSSWVHGLLDRLGVGNVGSATLYQRVVVSDDEGGVAVGPVTTFTFERVAGVSTEPLPESFVHHGSWPNPTAGPLTLAVDLPAPAEVRVDVYDLLGRHVLSASEALRAGRTQTVGLDVSALGPGVYAYRLAAITGAETEMAAGRLTVAR